MKLFDWIKNLFKKSKSSTRRPLTDEEYSYLRSKRQKKLDTILDKISKNGYNSLSQSEKQFLDNYN